MKAATHWRSLNKPPSPTRNRTSRKNSTPNIHTFISPTSSRLYLPRPPTSFFSSCPFSFDPFLPSFPNESASHSTDSELSFPKKNKKTEKHQCRKKCNWLWEGLALGAESLRAGLELGAGSARAGLESSHTQRRKKLF